MARIGRYGRVGQGLARCGLAGRAWLGTARCGTDGIGRRGGARRGRDRLGLAGRAGQGMAWRCKVWQGLAGKAGKAWRGTVRPGRAWNGVAGRAEQEHQIMTNAEKQKAYRERKYGAIKVLKGIYVHPDDVEKIRAYALGLLHARQATKKPRMEAGLDRPRGMR
jgi:hypothetical protein